MSDGSIAIAPQPGASGARLLVFRVGALVCAVEVDRVREILPRLRTTRIPGAPPVVAGLVNVRGTLVTVVEGWRALGQGQTAPQDPSASHPATGSTIILDVANSLVGFTVDEVMDMLAGGQTTLEDRQSLPGVDPTLVRAVGRWQEDIFVVLNVEVLLGPILTT